jgi:hypothetical protein
MGRQAMARKSVGLVHYYDTQSHMILCEAGGFELHSTKHFRGVTCSACIELRARERAIRPEAVAEGTSHIAG